MIEQNCLFWTQCVQAPDNKILIYECFWSQLIIGPFISTHVFSFGLFHSLFLVLFPFYIFFFNSLFLLLDHTIATTSQRMIFKNVNKVNDFLCKFKERVDRWKFFVEEQKWNIIYLCVHHKIDICKKKSSFLERTVFLVHKSSFLFKKIEYYLTKDLFRTI